jgi:hypothetical protein
MIYITKGDLNTFALTLTELTTISNPTYLFKFVWEMNESLNPVYFIGVDISAYPQRANIFELNEGVDATFNIGQYRYEVYESPVINPVDETGLDKIEEGRMVVEGTGNTIYD